MAVQIYPSDLLVNIDKKPPTMNAHNRSNTQLMAERFSVAAVTVQGDSTSRFRICQLPAGARYLAGLSKMGWTALGAGALASLGWERYRLPSGVWVAEDVDGLGLGLAVATAGRGFFDTMPTGGLDEMVFPAPATLIVVITGAVVPVGAAIGGTIVYGLG